jgi:DNA-binding NtrC family response regulator
MMTLPRKMSLVLLDDDPAMVRLLEKVITRNLGQRIEVVSFTAPEAAERWIDRNSCDVLLSDIEMPGKDGLEMLRLAKKRNAWTQVIFLTGHSTWGRISEALEAGASDYLLKPVDQQELISVLEHEWVRQTRWKAALAETLQGA